MDLRVENVGKALFEFTALFHNYLHVEDLHRMSLHGLTGTNYKDAADGQAENMPHVYSRLSFYRTRHSFKGTGEISEQLLFFFSWTDKIDGDSCVIPKGPLDRVYANSLSRHRIDCPSGRRVTVDKSESLTDTVIWTPWDTFSDGDFSLFLCVEPGNVINQKILGPNESFTASQTLRVEN